MQYTKNQYRIANIFNSIHNCVHCHIFHVNQSMLQIKLKESIKRYGDKISTHVQNIYNHKSQHPFKVYTLKGLFLGLSTGMLLGTLTAFFAGVVTIVNSANDKPMSFMQFIISYMFENGNDMSSSILENMTAMFLTVFIVSLCISMIINYIIGTAYYIKNIKTLVQNLRKE